MSKWWKRINRSKRHHIRQDLLLHQAPHRALRQVINQVDRHPRHRPHRHGHHRSTRKQKRQNPKARKHRPNPRTIC